MAQQLVDQLLMWLPPLEAGGAPIYHFADPDALPYERIPWSGATRQRRLTALAALQQQRDAGRRRRCGGQRPRVDAEDAAGARTAPGAAHAQGRAAPCAWSR